MSWWGRWHCAEDGSAGLFIRGHFGVKQIQKLEIQGRQGGKCPPPRLKGGAASICVLPQSQLISSAAAQPHVLCLGNVRPKELLEPLCHQDTRTGRVEVTASAAIHPVWGPCQRRPSCYKGPSPSLGSGWATGTVFCWVAENLQIHLMQCEP